MEEDDDQRLFIKCNNKNKVSMYMHRSIQLRLQKWKKQNKIKTKQKTEQNKTNKRNYCEFAINLQSYSYIFQILKKKKTVTSLAQIKDIWKKWSIIATNPTNLYMNAALFEILSTLHLSPFPEQNIHEWHRKGSTIMFINVDIMITECISGIMFSVR